MSYIDEAKHFEENEKPFHLGFLPTEQSNPLTAHLDQEFGKSIAAGIRNLQLVDRNVLAMAEKIFASAEFAALTDAIVATIRNGGKVVFSGCGATGRLSILLESMWRVSCPEYADQVKSIMTGGDYALVKSVESFEDYAQFGARQVQEMQMTPGDLLVAITEGGETSSVLGTVKEFTSNGGKAFLMFNNPAHLLRGHLERCREAIDNPAVTVLDLNCGPMALAGSTRMQATTSEQFIASAALEKAASQLYGTTLECPDFAAGFARLLELLGNDENVEKMAHQIDLEQRVYGASGLVTYFADDYILDLFTDTTERNPTFMLPGFHRMDDTAAPEPWAFVRNPKMSSPDAICRALGNRDMRCLQWQAADYVAMNAPESICQNPPLIAAKHLAAIPVGNEPYPARCATGKDAAVLFCYGTDDAALQRAYNGECDKFAVQAVFDGFVGELPPTRLKVYEHLAVKLQWNTISTGTMVCLGRVSGNWMSCVAISNKKLIDRAIRLVSELGNVDYHTACVEIFRAMESSDTETPAVLQCLARLRK